MNASYNGKGNCKRRVEVKVGQEWPDGIETCEDEELELNNVRSKIAYAAFVVCGFLIVLLTIYWMIMRDANMLKEVFDVVKYPFIISFGYFFGSHSLKSRRNGN